jgi:dienelactone hydrolase
MGPGISRRTALLGGAGLALSACGIDLPGGGGHSIDGSLASAAMRGARIGWTISYPKGHDVGDALPVVISLHGRSNDHRTAFSGLHLDDARDQAAEDGATPFAVASVDGGDHSYWHHRADGTDPEAMLRDEFLPLLEKRKLDVSRLGLHGWSMGGYGAMLLVRSARNWLSPVGVAVSSPAFFASAGATPAGAFDDAEDFRRNDVFAHAAWLKDVPLRIDCGEQDPFYPAVQDFRRRMRPTPSGGSGRGGHNRDYWRKVAPAQLRFLGSLLG